MISLTLNILLFKNNENKSSDAKFIRVQKILKLTNTIWFFKRYNKFLEH